MKTKLILIRAVEVPTDKIPRSGIIRIPPGVDHKIIDIIKVEDEITGCVGDLGQSIFGFTQPDKQDDNSTKSHSGD